MQLGFLILSEVSIFPKFDGWLTTTVKFFAQRASIEHFNFHNVAFSPCTHNDAERCCRLVGHGTNYNPPDVRHIYHAVALDEHRKPVSTTLWHYSVDHVAEIPKPKGRSEDLREKFNSLHNTERIEEADFQVAWEGLVDAEMYEELRQV